MPNDVDVRDARDQLNLILSFFSRVDAKLSTVLAIDTGMLGALGATVPPIRATSWYMAIMPILTVVLLGLSYCFLYRGGFPVIKGGYSSLVYFKNIAERNESAFVTDYTAQPSEQLRSDLLAQVWRNSEILVDKFRYLRLAFICMALSALPWVISLCTFAIHKSTEGRPH
jgi:hypothetical protein